MKATATVDCPGWRTGLGATWPWCHRCGLRADLHGGKVPFAEAVRRIVNGSRLPAERPL